MKILFINSVCGVGSTGKICTDLYDELKKNGHECCIAYGRGSAKASYNTYRIGTNLNNYIDGIKSRIFDNQGLNSIKATKKLVAFIEEYNPDVIHLHNLHGYYLNYIVLFDYLKKSFSGKVIWTLHDCWAFLPHSAFLQDLELYPVLPTEEPRHNLNNYPSAILFNNSKKNYHLKKEMFMGLKNMTIVTPSEWLKDLVKKSFLSYYPVCAINNGIDINIFKPLDNPKVFSKKLLGVANVWDDRKGLKFFNELSELLVDEYTITLVGKIRKDCYINPSIIHIPQTTNQEELANIYRSNDIFLNPTLIDNYPTTNLEALACGLPIIVFDTGGNKEMVYEEYGMVTVEKSSSSIEESIKILEKKIDGDPNFRMSKTKLSYISKSKMLENYMELYC